jgi:hypothetical protein
MTVLRVADILHIGQERAPRFTELQDNINSPESQRQFHLNQAIFQGPTFNIEQRSVYFAADPDNSSTFEDVEDQLHIIQKELDSCWAVLAEKYAYKYELSIHRIKSNLFDENKVATFNNKFLTRRLMLDANPDLVKLLIEPLYGNNPSYGVRELIQNAVDACNERKIMDDKFLGEIVARVDTQKNIFEISDNGIGMNEDILRNYFLVVGSSYRYSDAWREKYTDDNAKAKFARTGRFGIGGLASFLIGYEITVTTRHKDDMLGFEFTYTLEPKLLDVKRVSTNIGTKIVIKMHEKTSDRFNNDIKRRNAIPRRHPAWFNWYYYNTPKIYYYFDEKQIVNPFVVPNKDNRIEGWYDVPNDPSFPNIKLYFEKNMNNNKYSSTGLEICVNGILVNYDEGTPIFPGNRLNLNRYGFDITAPIVSIEDPDNILNIDLVRTRIYDFPYTLVREETFKYYLARLLTYPITNPLELITSHKFYNKYFAIRNNGFTICSQSFIYHTKPQTVIFLGSNSKIIFDSELLSEVPIAMFHRQKSSLLNGVVLDLVDLELQNIWYDPSNDNKILFLENKISMNDESSTTSPPFGLTLSKELFLIAEYAPENHTNEELQTEQLALFPDIEISPYRYLPQERDNLMLKMLREYLPANVNNGLIPFEMEKRKKFYPKAFSELKRYMQD